MFLQRFYRSKLSAETTFGRYLKLLTLTKLIIMKKYLSRSDIPLSFLKLSFVPLVSSGQTKLKTLNYLHSISGAKTIAG
jgi:hypothetical protein